MSRFAVLAFATLIVSCTGDVDTSPTLQFGLFPNVAHSGFNSTATFKVMFATGASNPTWSVGDPTMATIAPSAAPTIQGVKTTGLKFAVVTVLRDGQTTVSVKQGSTTVTSQLVIKAYTDNDVTVGKARYTTTDTDPNREACANCHQKAGGVDHSPLTMAGFDDDVILGVIQNGTWPASATGQSTTSAFAPTGPLTGLPAGVTHHWDLSKDDEMVGILAQLRSLPLGGVE